jgi:hypothetical protein
MVETRPGTKGTQKSAETRTVTGTASEGFTDAERVAMKIAQKFNSRYATFGFNDTANLDDGAMWPTSFALTELTAAQEATIGALVRKAVS